MRAWSWFYMIYGKTVRRYGYGQPGRVTSSQTRGITAAVGRSCTSPIGWCAHPRDPGNPEKVRHHSGLSIDTSASVLIYIDHSYISEGKDETHTSVKGIARANLTPRAETSRIDVMDDARGATCATFSVRAIPRASG